MEEDDECIWMQELQRGFQSEDKNSLSGGYQDWKNIQNDMESQDVCRSLNRTGKTPWLFHIFLEQFRLDRRGSSGRGSW